MRRKSYYEPSHNGIFRTSLRVKDLLAVHASGLGVMEIAAALRISRGASSCALVKLRKAGEIERVGGAIYRLATRTIVAPPAYLPDSFIRPVTKAQMMAGR